MMTAHTHQGRERRCHPPKKNLSTPMDKKSTYKKKENIMRSLPQLYTATEQNDDVTDGIVGGRLLRIELWNMK